jgi:hypothetical protein
MSGERKRREHGLPDRGEQSAPGGAHMAGAAWKAAHPDGLAAAQSSSIVDPDRAPGTGRRPRLPSRFAGQSHLVPGRRRKPGATRTSACGALLRDAPACADAPGR